MTVEKIVAALNETYRKELEAMTEDERDIEVHDRKGEEAATINNQGKEAQIAYLLGEE